MKESDIEKTVCQYAEKLGFETRKIAYINRTACPDRLIYGYGEVFFIEFKAPGKIPRADQDREINRMKEKGVRVFVVDNIDYGKTIIEGALHSANMGGNHA